MNTFGEKLRTLRREKKITRKFLSEYLGVSPRTISFYETNDREPSMENLQKLSELFNCSIDYLMGKYIPLTFDIEAELVEDILNEFKIDNTDSEAVKAVLDIVRDVWEKKQKTREDT